MAQVGTDAKRGKMEQKQKDIETSFGVKMYNLWLEEQGLKLKKEREDKKYEEYLKSL